MTCVTTVEMGEWIKGDKLAELVLELERKKADGTGMEPYPINDATAITLELRSQSTATSLSVALTTVTDGTAGAKAVVKCVDPGIAWTPPPGHVTEPFTGRCRITKAAGPGWAHPEITLTLRSAF